MRLRFYRWLNEGVVPLLLTSSTVFSKEEVTSIEVFFLIKRSWRWQGGKGGSVPREGAGENRKDDATTGGLCGAV